MCTLDEPWVPLRQALGKRLFRAWHAWPSPLEPGMLANMMRSNTKHSIQRFMVHTPPSTAKEAWISARQPAPVNQSTMCCAAPTSNPSPQQKSHTMIQRCCRAVWQHPCRLRWCRAPRAHICLFAQLLVQDLCFGDLLDDDIRQRRGHAHERIALLPHIIRKHGRPLVHFPLGLHMHIPVTG